MEQKTTEVVEWDGNKITLTFEGKDAKGAYHTYFMRQVEKLRHDLATRKGICCQQLKDALGKPGHYPMLVYISQGSWDDGRLKEHWHHGATGPGYYKLYDLAVNENVESELTTHVKMSYCPFCHANLDGVK